MSLVDLPVELLDQILTYLDWDPSKSLTPQRSELLSVSIVSKKLRDCTLPILLRTATLGLRWANNCLLEPGLFKIRRTPHLAQYIKRIHIQTDFRPIRLESRLPPDSKHYAILKDEDDWLRLGSSEPKTETDIAHRHRIHEIAGRLYMDRGLFEDGESAETMVAHMVKLAEGALSFQDRATALSIVMLAFPASTESIIFDGMPYGPKHSQQSVFALLVLSAAMEVFSNRLSEITMIDDPSRLSAVIPAPPGSSRSQLQITDARTIVNRDLVQAHLSSITSLRLKTSLLVHAPGFRPPTLIEPQINPSLDRWRPLRTTLQRLDLQSIGADVDALQEFLASFQALKHLRLSDAQVTQNGSCPPNGRLWLGFAISLRRALPRTKIEMTRLRLAVSTTLADCTVEWLIREAIPERAPITYDRETRLAEDFEAFNALWLAEAGERGKRASEMWAQNSETSSKAQLVDAAMASRWL